MKKIIITLLAIGLAGCSTEPVLPKNAKEVQASFEFQQKPKTARVTIIRDKGYVGSACSITSYINGKRLGKVRTSS